MKRLLLSALLLLVALLGLAAYYLADKQPLRDGRLRMPGLQAPVEVRYDERGVPHIRAQNDADLYRALGFVHAQDRLFQMEMLRRLANGELAEVFGAALLDTDRLFRTLRLRQHARQYVARSDQQSPAFLALQAYLEGVNHYQASRPAPLEFDLLGLEPRPFSAEDSLAIAGYMAYSFAAALRSEPLLTHIRDQLGAAYLAPFMENTATSAALPLTEGDWHDLQQLASLSLNSLAQSGLPQFEGSNAWAIAGTHTASGKPLLAGDPHIRFAAPAVWYEAHLSSPGLELYGHFQALNPHALLGFNQRFAWSITMFQNDDLDLIAERRNPDNPLQVWHAGRWVDLQVEQETILVKDAAPHRLTLYRSPNGPLINAALPNPQGDTPLAMWWAFLESDNPLLDAFYQLNRADSLPRAEAAAALIGAPGLNLVWASADGDIAWWAAAHLPRRPAGVDPAFILDASRGEARKDGFLPFSANPREVNPPRGYVLSANQAPQDVPVPGYYNLADRAAQLDRQLRQPGVRWDLQNSQALQLDSASGYPQRVLASLLGTLRATASADEQALVEELARWDGSHTLDSRAAVLFNQLLYQLTREILHDELGDAFFDNLLQTRVIDSALPRLLADPLSPWWDRRDTASRETPPDIIARAWRASLAHLDAQLGPRSDWQWGQAHRLSHPHPLGVKAPLSWLFNVGPFPAPGGHETPNNLSHKLGPAPWPVVYGPSTRRLIDLADSHTALGINPLGQTGVRFDRHYRDQASDYLEGRYQPMHSSPQAIRQHSRGLLLLEPAAP